jgi:ferredoxin
MATQIVGVGMSSIEALDAFQARYARCLAWAEGRARQKAGEAVQITRPTRVILKAKEVDESSLPECPACKVRLVWRRKALGGRSVFIVRCARNQHDCKLGKGCTQHDTLDGAVELWDRRRKRIEKERELLNPEKCLRCGLRGEHVCVGDIHHFIRSGLPAGGFVNMR